jgi:hypothetical protein
MIHLHKRQNVPSSVRMTDVIANVALESSYLSQEEATNTARRQASLATKDTHSGFWIPPQ